MKKGSMTDIHSHLIWGVDDGSRSLDLSLEMIRMSVAQGVGRIVCTPHYSEQFHGYDKAQALEKFEQLKAAVGDECELYLGQEIFGSEGMLQKLADGELLTMGGKNYVLMEFYPWESVYNIQRMVREVEMLSYHPILAHIERYEALADEKKVMELMEQGAYMQINCSDICGHLFDRTAAYCKRLLESGLVHFLGTDMHDTKHRAPKVKTALKWMNSNLDDEYVAEICSLNADKMLRGERI